MPTEIHIPKELLVNLYVTRQLSTIEIAKMLGTTKATIRRKLVRYGIERRTLTEAFAVSTTHFGKNPSRGPECSWWKGSKTHSSGYVMIHRPEHPEADANGYVFEHRMVAEQTIGRRLLPGEEVHHINEDRADNRPENLQVMTKSEHIRMHAIARHKRDGGKFTPKKGA